MTDQELKQLKDNLWHSADMLRASAHFSAGKYGQPILGLIFLRYADVLFKQHKKKIEANSFYSDPHDEFGNFDYVMANPPFNVDEVVVDKVIDDKQFNTYGVPRNKTKLSKRSSDKKETVPNANYLWIGFFATSLNTTGKQEQADWLLERWFDSAIALERHLPASATCCFLA